MPRLGYKEAQCRYCFRDVFLPYPTYRTKDLDSFGAIVCQDCRDQLEGAFRTAEAQ